MKKENSVLTMKIGYITVSALTVLLGIFLIIRPEISLNVICRILGAVMTACGAVSDRIFIAARVSGDTEAADSGR